MQAEQKGGSSEGGKGRRDTERDRETETETHELMVQVISIAPFLELIDSNAGPVFISHFANLTFKLRKQFVSNFEHV